MKRVFCLLVAVLIAAGSNGAASKKPSLRISVDPRQGFAPMHVTFHATLKEVSEDDKDYHCLKEEWDFGDGSVSSEQPDCQSTDNKTKLEFIVDHTYDDKGNYTAHLTLGDKKLRSNQVSVVVLQDPSKPD
jgi:hypothetical protein